MHISFEPMAIVHFPELLKILIITVQVKAHRGQGAEAFAIVADLKQMTSLHLHTS